jgi:hypothetical protein
MSEFSHKTISKDGIQTMGNRHFSLQERTDFLKAYSKSGLSAKKYAQLHSIGYSTLQRWLRNFESTVDADNVSDLTIISIPSSEQTSSSGPASSDDVMSLPPIHFMDITQHVNEHFSPKDAGGSLNFTADHDTILIPELPAIEAHSHNNSSLEIGDQVTPVTSFHQLDVFLPNGICLTLHQASFEEGLHLIRSLV